MPVILFHAGVGAFSGGYVGVDIFFVISGYLIASIILADLSEGRFSLLEFYERRARRILPALFFIAILCIPFAWWLLLPGDLQNFAQSLVAVATFSSNILFWLESGYFDTAADLKPLLHTWSLAVEEQYYLFFPILLAILWKGGMRWVWTAMGVLFAVSFAISAWGVENSPVATFYLLPTRGWELLAGVCIALAMKGELPGHLRNRTLNDALSISGLLLIAVAILAFDEQTAFPGPSALLPVAGTAMVILFAQHGTLVQGLLSTRILVGVGLISYSAYLWHHPIFAFAKYRSVDALSDATTAILFLMTWPLAYASWRYVERPMRNRRFLTRNTILTFSAVGVAALAALGFYGHVSGGMPSRLDARQAPMYEALELARKERIQNILSGTCHFNEKGAFRKLGDFVDHWSCRSPKTESGRPEILVFGDSHSADKAFALRQAGISISQLGGSNCPLVPEFVTPISRHCVAILELAKSLNGPDLILLSGRFTESLLTETYLEAIGRFWAGSAGKVVLFSPMPDFSVPLKETLIYGKARSAPSFAREQKFFEVLEHVTLPENFVVVKTSALWCPDAQAAGLCAVHDGTNWLMTDADHLSAAGATSFGLQVANHGILQAPTE